MNRIILPRDPRWLQIAVLGGLLLYGVFVLEFGVSAQRLAFTVGTALLCQYGLTRAFRLPRFDPKSALITSFSLTLLLRVPHDGWAMVAAALAIGSKFSIRVRGKHVFNPANFAIVALLLLDRGWVAPGQWGAVALFALVLGGAGVFVTARSERFDITAAFLAGYGALLVGRALWLGDPLSIPLHAMQNGSLILFAFFMISDPKTTPSSRAGRILFALAVAAVTYGIRFTLYRSDGVMWALCALAPLTPLFDRIFEARAYQWPTQTPTVAFGTQTQNSGEQHVAA